MRVRDFTAMLEVEIAGDHIDLPSFPEVALRVRRALADENVSVDVVVRALSAEPSLVVRLLQLANSAALNPSGRRLTDLRAAITRIGFNMARSATIAFAMAQLRRAEAYKGLDKPFNELWRTSTQVAAVSFVVAKHLTKVNPELALLAGLLHTVGKLYLLTRASRYPELLNDDTVYPALVQAWHARIANAILVNWELAPPVIEAVHGFEACDREREGDIDLLDVLWVGRSLAALPGRGHHGAARVSPGTSPRARCGHLRSDTRGVGAGDRFPGERARRLGKLAGKSGMSYGNCLPLAEVV